MPDAMVGSAPLFLRVGLVIDGVGGSPLRDALIRIDGQRITAVGRAAEFGGAPEIARILDFSRGVAMPGMVDCHAHPTFPSDSRSIEEQLADPDEMLTLTAVRQLTIHLKSGVTTVRDCAARGRTMFRVRDALRRGYFAGPRLQLAGRAITQRGGHGHWSGTVADTPEEIRRAVDELVAEGADVIKLVASGGGTKGSPPPYRASYSAERLRVGVEAAHARGRSTVAHARATRSIENCVDAGVDAIAHVEFLSPGEVVHMGGAAAPTGSPSLDRRVAEKLAASSAWLDLDPQSSGWDAVLALRAKAGAEGLSAAERTQLANLERYFERFLAVISGLVELGLADRMAFGSDAGPFSTEFGHLEYNVHLARLAGLSPMQSLQAVTRNAARLCGLDPEVGTLEAGRDADILVLEANPLEDVRHLTHAAAVFRSGSRVA